MSDVRNTQDWWKYNNLPSGEPYNWGGASRGTCEWDLLDFHLDIGCGKLKKGRLGIDRFLADGVDLAINLETLLPMELPVEQCGCFHVPTEELSRARNPLRFIAPGLPFPDNSIESIISHHCFEHILEGFVPLIDECYRVLKPGGVLRVITPLFPSRAAVEDPDHKRWIMEGTFETFCGDSQGNHWHESFSVPYTSSRFELVHKDISPGLKPRESWGDPEVDGLEPDELWGPKDVREIRVALRKWD